MAVCVLALGISDGGRMLQQQQQQQLSPSLCGAMPRFLCAHTFPSRSSKRRASLSVKCESKVDRDKVEFGYSRKDVLLVGLGFTVFGVGLKYGLELIGLDSVKAGNVVQLVMVLGLTVGWIYSYVFRVANKDMTYAKQLKDYELKVMEKRFQELPEAEVEVLLAQVEEEKERKRNSKSSTS